MCTNETGVCLWLAISHIINERWQRAAPTGPVIVWDKVEVFIESWLRLLINNSEYLVNSSAPYPELLTMRWTRGKIRYNSHSWMKSPSWPSNRISRAWGNRTMSLSRTRRIQYNREIIANGRVLCIRTRSDYQRAWNDRSYLMTAIWERKTYGLTVTPSAQSLCAGGRPLSGGAWKAPPIKYP